MVEEGLADVFVQETLIESKLGYIEPLPIPSPLLYCFA